MTTTKKPRWPIETPDDVRSVAWKYYGGTTQHAKFRIHEWNAAGILASTPAGSHWSGIGMRSPHGAEYVLLPRDGNGVGVIRGALKKWEGRTKKAELRAALAGCLPNA